MFNTNLPILLNRLNKTLNFANQVIPLYMKAKPMLKNAKDAFQVVKTFTEKTNKPSPNIPITPQINISKTNQPTFFL